MQQRRLFTKSGRDGVEHRRLRIELGFLRHERELEPGLAPHPAVVGREIAGDDLEQARLAGAVAPDEADPLARLDREARPIEQRDVAVGERGLRQLQERQARIPPRA
jgi:hypothetical protein